MQEKLEKTFSYEMAKKYNFFSIWYENVFAICNRQNSFWKTLKLQILQLSRIGEALNSKAQRDCTAEFNLKCET